MTKQFTAVAVLQLVEAGKLRPDDPVARYYPETPPAWAPVTIRHLLTHSSGIAPHPSFRGAFAPRTRLDWTPQEIVALSADKPLAFTPGSRFAYNNTGYDLLGVIVERLSGQPYAAYLRDHVLGPAGLTETRYDTPAEVQPRRAAGYRLEGDGLENAPYISTSLLYAAGGLSSTVDDLLRWDQALQGGKVLKPGSIAEMFRDQGFHYGFGEYVDVDRGHRHWGHGGGLPGFASTLDRYPDDGLTVIVLSNLEQANATRIGRMLAQLYFDPQSASLAGPPGAAERAAYVGRYRLTPQMTIVVSEDAGRLYASLAGQPKVEIVREAGAGFFFMSSLPMQLTFEAGRPAPALVLHQGLDDKVAPRLSDPPAS